MGEKKFVTFVKCPNPKCGIELLVLLPEDKPIKCPVCGTEFWPEGGENEKEGKEKG